MKTLDATVEIVKAALSGPPGSTNWMTTPEGVKQVMEAIRATYATLESLENAPR